MKKNLILFALLLSFCGHAIAEDTCLVGSWKLESESGTPAGGGTFTQGGVVLVEMQADPAPGENNAAKRGLVVRYESYEGVSVSDRGGMKTHKRGRFDDEARGHWLHPAEGKLTWTLGEIPMAAAMKMEMPGVAGADWREMPVSPTTAPHAGEYRYTCSGDTLTLERERHPGLGLAGYTARFKRR